ncbi:hypothetical protein JG687_00016421 [Phytophthora cactorum]|uniref:Uncharacterized protein n=1 Tax=Phytophthora cactorum TaxID=29920 RepID=A0A8T1TQQ9_9STRA|nr:hypothetical protein JG687_00016421 [Phytophthora cactorum]
MVKHRFETNGVPTNAGSVSRSFCNLHCHQQTLKPPPPPLPRFYRLIQPR